jgi:hypothetical protein
MSKDTGKQLDLTGEGAAYVRVSDNEQDTRRQYEAIHAFEQRYGVIIPPQRWFEDEGWARDTADRRPDFQRLVKLVEASQIRWIVVDQLDRFGTKNSKQLIAYLYRLDEAGCKLYDCSGKEWTGEDIATVITAVVEGEKSKGEQTSKSHRILGGKIAKARLGEWQGGPVRLGFDVACYHRETSKELWRVIFEGRHKRLKLYPDGRSERFDGQGNFPKFQEVTEVLRVAPSRDQDKIEAVLLMFRRFATEADSLTTLAHDLNQHGFRTSFGGYFQGQQVEEMLRDANYLGYYTYNRTHNGKFHRWTDGQAILELNYEEKATKTDPSDWVKSHRLFPPLIDQATWDAVQRKLTREKRAYPPRTAGLYLNGLVYCGNCGVKMIAAGRGRPSKSGPPHKFQFVCCSYHTALRKKQRHTVKCLRNSVYQSVLEPYVERFLDETGHRLDLLTQGPNPNPRTTHLQQQQEDAWAAFRDGIMRLTRYLAEHRREEYEAILREHDARQAAEEADTARPPNRPLPRGTLVKRYGRTLDDSVKAHADDPTLTPQLRAHEEDFVAALLDSFRRTHDPAEIQQQIDQLDNEHTALMKRYADLPTPRAKEKAKKELAAVEGRIAQLEQQQQDIAESVEQQYQKLQQLQQAIAEAKRAMRSESGERALRRRAEAIRAVIHRIECKFVATGHKGGGPGKNNARLAAVTIYPIVGDAGHYPIPSAIRSGERRLRRS